MPGENFTFHLATFLELANFIPKSLNFESWQIVLTSLAAGGTDSTIIISEAFKTWQFVGDNSMRCFQYTTRIFGVQPSRFKSSSKADTLIQANTTCPHMSLIFEDPIIG